jgi:hypothetical protein
LMGVVLAGGGLYAQQAATGGTELDRFMQQVLARRDDNWRKLQQYILDEQERIELRGPGGMLVWGQKREYTWFVREGYFVRSPVRFNGVAIGEADRQKYEDRFLNRAKERDKRGQENPTWDASIPAGPPPSDVQSLIQQTREPQFISSAYFLRFRFDEGRYALAGRETVSGRQVLRIEYYPTKLFSDDPGDKVQRRQKQAAGRPDDKDYEREVQRVINKESMVTLWVEPTTHQIVKYTFDNLGFGFLPMAWLVRIADLKASMEMSEAFKDVWLPKSIDAAAAIVLAAGRFDMTYSLGYNDYREATVTTKVRGASVR